MTNTAIICATVATCFTQAMGVIGYWLKKRKLVDVTRIKYVHVGVKSEEGKGE